MRKTLVAVAAVVLALGVGMARPATAVLRDSINLSPNDDIEREYPAISGQNPTNQAQDSATCETAVYCDTIPVNVNVPSDLPADANYVVQVTLTWETAKANGTTVNDVDLYFEDDQRQVVSKSASQNEPESLRAPKPKSGKYYIAVVNYVGNNPGYTLRVQYLTDESNTFELLDGGNQGPPPAGKKDADSSPPPVDHSNDPTEFTEAPAPPIATFEAGVDSSFDPSLFDDNRTRNGGPGFDPNQLAGSEKIKSVVPPASGVAVFISLVVLPLLIVGGAGAFIWRKRAASF